MRIRIISYEEVSSWILGKFVLKMQENLQSLGIESNYGNTADPTADINHHVMNWGYKGQKSSIDTLMVTHVESLGKLNLLKDQLKVARLGICMSAETVARMKAGGIPGDRLTYVNPAHDEVLKPRKFVIGITSRTYPDGRRKEDNLVRIAESIPAEYFEFRIMGSGWNAQVEKLRALGFEVQYNEGFDRTLYLQLMSSLDYYLSFSWDEGSMGFVDALSAGVRTLSTPQGFHLDAIGGLTHPLHTIDVATQVLNQAAQERASRVSAVSEWTWKNYTLKHVGIWRYLLGQEPAMPAPGFGQNDSDSASQPDVRIDKTRFYLQLMGNHLKFKGQEYRGKIKRRLGI